MLGTVVKINADGYMVFQADNTIKDFQRNSNEAKHVFNDIISSRNHK
ncbi:hypothetical protein [Sphingobacterium sp. NPDC055431]